MGESILIYILKNKYILNVFSIINYTLQVATSCMSKGIVSQKIGGKYKVYGQVKTPDWIHGISGFQIITYRYKLLPIAGLCYIKEYKHKLLSNYCLRIRIGFHLLDRHVECTGMRKWRIGFTINVNPLNKFNRG